MDRLGTFSSCAIGAASTLQAYMEPMHRLMRQQITKRTHRFLVNAAICSLVNFILFLSLSLVFGNKMALRYTMPMKPDFIFLWPFPGLF